MTPVVDATTNYAPVIPDVEEIERAKAEIRSFCKVPLNQVPASVGLSLLKKSASTLASLLNLAPGIRVYLRNVYPLAAEVLPADKNASSQFAKSLEFSKELEVHLQMARDGANALKAAKKREEKANTEAKQLEELLAAAKSEQQAASLDKAQVLSTLRITTKELAILKSNSSNNEVIKKKVEAIGLPHQHHHVAAPFDNKLTCGNIIDVSGPLQ
ncbi:hypothetical protein CDL15_Pgr016059 [Punica granatum]|uniref:Uncharacterized protein n=1 Tax=Punica granatum TaxID=22663 RepID=A0A218XRY9_PUNGR|nr:hypothetical protein CDL15_Pgr016059 [Punica granatum]